MMRNKWIYFCISGILLSAFALPPPAGKPSFHFPYREAGLTERQAAAHLISRFTYGATPGQVDKVVDTGLEIWFRQQLMADQPDDKLNQRIGEYDVLKLSNEEIVRTYLNGGQVLRMAIKDGVIDKDSVK